jgi:hypothetical protein
MPTASKPATAHARTARARTAHGRTAHGRTAHGQSKEKFIASIRPLFGKIATAQVEGIRRSLLRSMRRGRPWRTSPTVSLPPFRKPVPRCSRFRRSDAARA